MSILHINFQTLKYVSRFLQKLSLTNTDLPIINKNILVF